MSVRRRSSTAPTSRDRGGSSAARNPATSSSPMHGSAIARSAISRAGNPRSFSLEALGKADFVRILTEPRSALIKQYTALMETEGIELTFTPGAVERIADFATQVNERTENIGARRLHTVMEKLLDEISFEGPDLAEKVVTIDEGYVNRMLSEIVKNEDLSRYIL